MVNFIFRMTKFILLLVMAAMFLLSCNSNLNFNNGINGNGNITTTNRSVSEAFETIEAKTGITVIIEQANEASIVARADENLQEHLKTEISNGILSIYFDENINRAEERKVFVKVPKLTKIAASSGASVKGINTIKSENLALKSSSGSEINLSINSKNLSCDSSSGSKIEANGKTENLRTESSSGSSILLENLETANAVSKASSGSSTKVSPIESLDAEASSGSSIKCYTNPKKIKVDENSGGSISKK